MVAKFSRSRTVSGTTASGGGDKAPRIDQLVEMFQPKEKVWYQLRLVGPMFSYGFHWIEIESKKGKNGIAKFTKQCLAYSDEAESLDSTCDCPYCELLGKAPAVHYYQNVIVRKRQESAPKNASSPTKDEAKSGFKDMDSDSWTPVQVMRLPVGGVGTLRSLSELNKHGKKGDKKPYDLSDEEYGCDVQYMFDNSKQGSGKHAFQKAEHTPLDEDEAEFLIYNIEDIVVAETEKVAQTECDRLDGKVMTEGEDGEYAPRKSHGRGHAQDDEDDEPPARKKKPAVDDDDDAPPPKKRKPTVDEDEDEAPAKPKGKKAAPEPEEDDDEYTPEEDDMVTVTDEDDEVVTGKVTAITAKMLTIEDEDEDEHKFKLADVTVVKFVAKPKATAKAKAKPVVDDDDDEDDEPPAKKKKAAVVDDDDEEETPKPKKRKPGWDD